MSILIKRQIARRSILRGMLGGGALTVALPLFDCFLDDHGEALASGAPIPVRFGTWYWGMGHTPGYAVKERTSVGPVEFLEECKPLNAHRDYINYFGGFNTPLDGRSNYPHESGWIGSRTGAVPSRSGEIPAPTFDLLIADAVGGGTRFRNIDLTSMGNPRETYTARNTFSRAAAETSPVAFYARMFGPEFADPNKGDFKPDPRVMVRKSVLSGIQDESQQLIKSLGAVDQQRLDEYFTSIRQLEGQLALQLEKPPANDACRVPPAPPENAVERQAFAVEIDTVTATHKILTDILVMAVACNQTRVFNMVYNDNFSRVRRKGETYTHHVLTHEEQADPKLGYQPTAFWFNCKSMEACATFLESFKNVREGAGTLLDNMLMFANSETSFARIHSVDNIPVMTFGKAGGRIKTGLHVVGNGDPVTRVGFTCMRVMGMPIESWGVNSLRTTKPISEILV